MSFKEMLINENHKEALHLFINERANDEVRLRHAEESDSEFLLRLRLDPSRNKNLSSTTPKLESQIKWMRFYKERFSKGLEAYFIIQRVNQDIGSLRLYDYKPSGDSFCWGSWIIAPGAPPSVAYQSVILVYDLGFRYLKFTASHFDVRQANASVWKFHEKMGAKLVCQDEQDRFYEYKVHDYIVARDRLSKSTQNRPF
jgi:RimJ/RimL family protein N-acetyltransferase